MAKKENMGHFGSTAVGTLGVFVFKIVFNEKKYELQAKIFHLGNEKFSSYI